MQYQMRFDQEQLISQYCELYWEVNELQLVGNTACIMEAARLSQKMAAIVKLLGYTPAA